MKEKKKIKINYNSAFRDTILNILDYENSLTFAKQNNVFLKNV